MDMRPCLISISWKRRYFSGFFVISCSGSYTPSGLVVPTSPGVMAVIETPIVGRARPAAGAWKLRGEMSVDSMAKGRRKTCQAEARHAQ